MKKHLYMYRIRKPNVTEVGYMRAYGLAEVIRFAKGLAGSNYTGIDAERVED